MMVLISNNKPYDFKKNIPNNEVGDLIQKVLDKHEAGDNRDIARYLVQDEKFTLVNPEKNLDQNHICYEVNDGKILIIDEKVEPTKLRAVMDVKRFINLVTVIYSVFR